MTEQAAIVALLVAAVLALGVLVLAPRRDSPVALVPLGSDAARAIPDLLAAPDTRLLGRGSMPGSYIVLGKRPSFVEGLLRDGVLILNATAPACGPLVTDLRK